MKKLFQIAGILAGACVIGGCTMDMYSDYGYGNSSYYPGYTSSYYYGYPDYYSYDYPRNYTYRAFYGYPGYYPYYSGGMYSTTWGYYGNTDYMGYYYHY